MKFLIIIFLIISIYEKKIFYSNNQLIYNIEII